MRAQLGDTAHTLSMINPSTQLPGYSKRPVQPEACKISIGWAVAFVVLTMATFTTPWPFWTTLKLDYARRQLPRATRRPAKSRSKTCRFAVVMADLGTVVVRESRVGRHRA